MAEARPDPVREPTAAPGPARARLRPFLAPVVLAGAGALVTLEGDRAGAYPLIAALALLVPVAAIVERRRMPPTRRRLLAPLTFFFLAFAVIMLVRAVPLASGVDGRYFSLGHDQRVRSILAVGPRLGPGGERLYNTVQNPSFEQGTIGWEPPTSDAELGFSAILTAQAGPALSGRSSGRLRVRTGTGATYVALVGNASAAGQYSLAPGDRLFASIAVRPESDLPRRARIELAVRFRDAQGNFLDDTATSGPEASAEALGPGAWQRLAGDVEVPAGAASDSVVLLLRRLGEERRHVLSVDAAMVTTTLRAGVSAVPYFDGDDDRSVWHGAYGKALGIAVGSLLVILAGFILPPAGGLSRLPSLTIVRPDHGRRRRLMLGLLAVGIAGYALELRAYGGYGAYLDALGALGVEGLGKWYLHAAALIPSAMGIAVLVRWIVLGREGRPSVLEVAVAGIGLGIACSYFLKAAVAIPALTIVLAAYYHRGRAAAIWLWVAGGLFAVATPFIYLVRGEGRIDLSQLSEAAYWNSFLDNLTSRFFHFESLMIAAPFGGSESVLQPIKDFAVTAVPRAIWADKPLSPAARFTAEFLRPGLHTPTDIGVLSLPGELWLAGGVAGVLIFGLLIGILLRTATGLVANGGGRATGTLLLGCALTVGLVMLNDGWGVASVLVVNLIAQVGWLPFVRRGGEG